MGVGSGDAPPASPSVTSVLTGASLERLALAPELAPPVSAPALCGAARLRPALGLRSPFSPAASSAGVARLPALRDPRPAVPDLDALRPWPLSGDPGVAKASCTLCALQHDPMANVLAPP